MKNNEYSESGSHFIREVLKATHVPQPKNIMLQTRYNTGSSEFVADFVLSNCTGKKIIICDLDSSLEVTLRQKRCEREDVFIIRKSSKIEVICDALSERLNELGSDCLVLVSRIELLNDEDMFQLMKTIRLHNHPVQLLCTQMLRGDSQSGIYGLPLKVVSNVRLDNVVVLEKNYDDVVLINSDNNSLLDKDNWWSDLKLEECE